MGGVLARLSAILGATQRPLRLNLKQVFFGKYITLREKLAVIASLKFEPNDLKLLGETSAIVEQAKLKEICLRLININIQRISRTTKDGEAEMGGEE